MVVNPDPDAFALSSSCGSNPGDDCGTTSIYPENSRSTQDHRVLLFENDAQLYGSVGSFLGSSLGIGGAAVVIATVQNIPRIEAQIEAFGINIDYAKANGSLMVLDAAQVLSRFMVGDLLDSELYRALMKEVFDRNSCSGARVNVYGEIVDLLIKSGNLNGAFLLERMWDGLATRYEASLLSSYSFDSQLLIGRSRFEDLCGRHTRVSIKSYR